MFLMYEVLHYPMVQRVLIRKVPPQTRDSLPALSRMNLNAVVSWVEEGNRWLATRPERRLPRGIRLVRR